MYGYLGYATLPFKNYGTSYVPSSIYAISNETTKEVLIIPLTIGCFNDLYKFINSNKVFGYTIKILPLSINYDYISDIYNIVTIFSNKERNINWVFPKRPKYYYSEQFEVLQIHDIKYESIESDESSISIEYIESGVEDLYDIVIRTNDFTKYFSLYMTDEKVQMCQENNYEIHMCGENSRHGGLCGLDIGHHSDIFIFNIHSSAGYDYLKTRYKVGYEYERW